MKKTRTSIVLGAVGAVLVVLAAVVQFLIAPKLTQLPSDTDETIAYRGTATVLDSKALAAGDVAHAVAKDVPTALKRQIQVVSTDGGTAIVTDATTTTIGTTKLPVSSHRYAIDRTTLEATTPPAGSGAEHASGLTISFPIHPKQDSSYRLWDSLTQSSGVAKFEGTKTVGGRTANVYTTSINGPVKDAHTIAALPAALPKQLVAGLVPMLPENAAAQLTAALPSLPDMVPMTYTGVTKVTADVDSQTGVALDQQLAQSVISGVTVSGTTTPLAPVTAVDASMTPSSQADLHDKAVSAGHALTALGAIPVALLVVGGVLIVAAVVVSRKAGTAAGTTGPAATEAPTASTSSSQS